MSIKSINLLVDERPIKAHLGYTIMQTCAAIGVEIPRFCYHDKLLIAGNCRICLVEVTGSKKLVAACAVHVSDNMAVYTNTSRVRLARQNVLEFLLANHPLDCPICDQGGECDLQDITTLFGADRGRFYEIEKRSVMNKDFGPLIRTSMNRCIHCTRCVRFLAMSSGISILGTLGRGSATEIGTYINQFISDELSGNITDLCPVGALTSKPYSFKARPWELVSIKGVDVFDSLNSTLTFDVMANKICRVLPYSNDALNECWLSNKARYAYDALFLQRLDSCSILAPQSQATSLYSTLKGVRTFVLHNHERRIKITWDCAFSLFISNLFNSSCTNFTIVPGNFLDLVSTFQLKFFVNTFGGASVMSETLSFASSTICDNNFLYLFNTSLSKLSSLPSFCLLLGTNLRFESPLLNFRINKLVSERNIPIYKIGGSVTYSTYKAKLISTSLTAFYSICEFKHFFCKNFYVSTFAFRPFILVAGSLLNQFASISILSALVAFTKRLLNLIPSALKSKWLPVSEFSYFGFIHQYSSAIHFSDVALTSSSHKSHTRLARLFSSSDRPSISQHSDKLKSILFFYIVGADFDLTKFLISSSLFTVYQGSHGAVAARNASLVFASTVYVERSCVYRNLLGLSQKTDIVIKYAFGAKSEEDIFRGLLFSLSNAFFRKNWLAFSYKNGVVFNASLLVAAEYLKDSFIFFDTIYNTTSLNSTLFIKDFSYVLAYTNKILPLECASLVPFNFLPNTTTRIFPNLFSSIVINYYGDSTSTLITSSKTMALCSSLNLKKNFSFTSIYY